MKCLKPLKLVLALFSLEGIEHCVPFSNVHIYIKNEGMICFPSLGQITKIFCSNKASGWCWKRIAVHNRKRRLQCTWRRVTSGLGIFLLVKEQQIGMNKTSQFLQICTRVLWWERFALLAVKQRVGALVEDPWLRSFPPERGKRCLPSFNKTCLLSLDLHHNFKFLFVRYWCWSWRIQKYCVWFFFIKTIYCTRN